MNTPNWMGVQRKGMEGKGEAHMKALFRVLGGRITLELEGGTQKELFAAIADAQDVFDADRACGLCQDDNLKFQVRHIEGNAYYELACRGCGARLQYGQHREGGTLYPKRRDGKHGWEKFQRATETSPAGRPADRQNQQTGRQLKERIDDLYEPPAGTRANAVASARADRKS